MQNLPNYFTTPNKMTSENDILGLVSLKFLRPWDKCIEKCTVNSNKDCPVESLQLVACIPAVDGLPAFSGILAVASVVPAAGVPAVAGGDIPPMCAAPCKRNA